MITCLACGLRKRSGRLAIVLLGPKRAKRGKVCKECARTGWLFVLGHDAPPAALDVAPKRDSKRDAPMLEKWGMSIRAKPSVLVPARKAAPTKTPSAAVQSLGVGAEAILTCAIRNDPASLALITVETGYKRSSRGEYLRRLRAAGLITGTTSIRATDAGRAMFPGVVAKPTSGAALRAYARAQLRGGELRVWEFLTRHPIAVTERFESMLDGMDYKRSALGEFLRRLAARGYVERVGRGEWTAAREFFR